MNADLTVHQDRTALAEQMEFAKLATSGAGQSILPDIYRGNPANVIIAVGLGASMGLSPAESLYRISVIKGKPSAGAELIAANVRKAGHRLRVRGDETTCTATIVRADDPDYEFSVTRDLAWAKQMGLATNDNYKKQPGTMLQWRAITAVARLACPEALYGVAYTPDELADLPGQPAQAARPVAGGSQALRAAVAPQEAPAEREEPDAASPADQSRADLREWCAENGLDPRGAAARWAAEHGGESLRDATDAGAIDEFRRALVAELAALDAPADDETGAEA